MDQSAEQLLAQLRGAHAPADPGWWPPAPGWWLIAVLLSALLGLFMWWLRARSRPHWRKSALRALDQLDDRKLHTAKHCSAVLAECSTLMRRVGMAVRPRQRVARLTGQDWLRMLDSIGNTDQYSAGVGRLLTHHPYMPPGQVPDDQIAALLKLMRRTIRTAREAPVEGARRTATMNVHKRPAADSRQSGPSQQLEAPAQASKTDSSIAVTESSAGIQRYRQSGVIAEASAPTASASKSGRPHVRV